MFRCGFSYSQEFTRPGRGVYNSLLRLHFIGLYMLQHLVIRGQEVVNCNYIHFNLHLEHFLDDQACCI